MSSFFGQIIPKPILIKLVIILVSNQLKKENGRDEVFDMTENNKIDFETIDYSKVNPKKLNGNKRIVKSYLIYFAFDVVLTVAIFLLTLFKLIDSSDNTVNTVIFILSGILCLCLYANNYYKSKDWRFYESLRSDTLTKLIALFFVIMVCCCF